MVHNRWEVQLSHNIPFGYHYPPPQAPSTTSSLQHNGSAPDTCEGQQGAFRFLQRPNTPGCSCCRAMTLSHLRLMLLSSPSVSESTLLRLPSIAGTHDVVRSPSTIQSLTLAVGLPEISTLGLDQQGLMFRTLWYHVSRHCELVANDRLRCRRRAGRTVLGYQ